MSKEYISPRRLSTFFNGLKNLFATKIEVSETNQELTNRIDNIEQTVPTIEVVQEITGAIVTTTDKNGTTEAFIANGKSGVHVGTEEPMDNSNVWINPKGKESNLVGKSAYEIALDQGFEGSEEEWLESLVGKDYVLTEADKTEIAGMVNAVPNYIIAEAERVAKAVQATRTAKSLVFPVMSDMHLYVGNETHDASLISAQYAGMGVKELKKRMNLDFIGYLGDFTWGASDYTAEQVMKDITAVKETTDTAGAEVWCVGNHDLNYGKKRDRLLTLDEIYSHIEANSDGVKPYENIERGYGYLDFEQQKIRVIYLNTCDTSELVVTEGKSAPAGWISPTQIQWLADTALDFTDKAYPSDWGVVIMSHHPLHDGASDFDNTMKILEAYRDGLSGTLSCTIRTETDESGNKTYPQQAVSYDFSATDRAEIICNIHGHNHNLGYSQISSSTRTNSGMVEPWLWRLCIPNISANRYNTGYENAGSNEYKQKLYGEFDKNGNPVEWTKEAGTAKATSFCVVSIDRRNKKIYAHVFGAGRDRVVSYGGEEIVMHSVTNNLTNCSSSNSNTEVEAGAAYSATLTASEGYTMDGAIIAVTMGGVDITSTVYSNGTVNITSVTGDVVIAASAVTAEAPEEPTYTNQLDIAGYTPDVKISSTDGNTTGASSYATTGYIPIGYGSNNNAKGEQVIYLANIEATPSDGNVRIAFYDAEKSFIVCQTAANWKASASESANVYTLNDAGYIDSIDASAYTSYLCKNLRKTPAYFRFCAKGLDGDSIITVNEDISSSPEAPVISYSIIQNLTNCTGASGNATTISEDGNATLTFIANDGCALPDAITVSGATYDWVPSTGTVTLSAPTGDVTVTIVAVEEEKELINILPMARTTLSGTDIYGVDYDGNGVNDGYKKGVRYRSSTGQITEGQAESYTMTGFWDYTYGDTFYVKGITTTSNSFVVYMLEDGSIGGQVPTTNSNSGEPYLSEPDANGVRTFRGNQSWKGIALSVSGINGDTIVTKNQPIE